MTVESLANFRRVAPKADTTTGVRVAVADLQKFVGKFGAKDVPFTVDVQMVGSALRMSVPDSPRLRSFQCPRTRSMAGV